MDREHWVAMQRKTFTKWMNSRLTRSGYPAVNDLLQDLQTGLPLINLLTALGKGPIPCSAKPKTRILRVENVSLLLSALRKMNVPLVNIGPEDIVDGNEKLILGLVWTIISRVEHGGSSAGMSAVRSELLEWVRAVTSNYPQVNITNFSTAWRDGLAFNAIIHYFRPSLVDFDSLVSDKDSVSTLNNAFFVAEAKLGIPRLLDAEDVATSEVPDEKSIMTYVLQYYHRFKNESDERRSKTCLKEFIAKADKILLDESSYENKAREFVKDKERLRKRFEELALLYNSLVAAIAEEEKNNDDLVYAAADLSSHLSRIHGAAFELGIRKYEPPAEISGEAVDSSYIDVSEFDPGKLKSVLSRFDGEQAQIIESAKETGMKLGVGACEALLNGSDIDPKELRTAAARAARQLSAITQPESKRKTAEKLRLLISESVSAKKDNTELLEKLEKLFRMSDPKRSGVITRAAFRNILRALSIAETDRTLSDIPSEIGIEEARKVVNVLNLARVDDTRVRAALQAVSEKKISGNELDISVSAPHLLSEDGSIDLSIIESLIVK